MFRSRSRATWGVFSFGVRGAGVGWFLRGESEKRKQLCILFFSCFS